MRKKDKRKLALCAALCLCACCASGIGILRTSENVAVVAETTEGEPTIVTPTEVKADAAFDENGIYTSDYEINITFSTAFTTNGIGNSAPTLFSDLADKLQIGGTSLSAWWTLFDSNQNNFTVQNWDNGKRLRINFNRGLMTLTNNTALDGTFYIELTEDVTNDQGTFKAFKYKMTPTSVDGSWRVIASQEHTDTEIDTAIKRTASLSGIDLKLCASVADHNLQLTFDEKVFSHDGVVASSGQIGVLAKIKLNGKTFDEWYNYNSPGTLDTVAFYPQSECKSVVMQFKLNRMAALFDEDPIYYNDLLVESEELTWEYYEGEQLTIVTIPSFSYTYSQAYGAFYKTDEVPESTNEELKVKDVSPISTFKEDSGQTPGTQVFSISFWSDFCGMNSIFYLPSYETLVDYVYLNGKSLRTIKETAVDKEGNAFSDGVTIQMCGYMGNSDKRLVVYLNGNLADEFLFQKVDTDTITLKKGLTSKCGQTLAEDVTFEYYSGMWRKTLDTSSLEYTDLQVTTISRLQSIGDTVNGKRAVTFFIYFDRPVSYERLLYVARNKENLLALKNSGALNVSEEKIYGIVDNHIGDYILDYIKYDGKTLRELLKGETTVAMQTWGLDIHYTGDTFYTNAIQFTINAEASFLPVDNEKHTLEITAGFVSPLLGKTSKTYTFELQPDSSGWKNITGASTEQIPELPKSDYEEPTTDVGCVSTLNIMPITLVTLLFAVSVMCFGRREKDEK